jgi:putative chitinase
MGTLRQGSSGPGVVALQDALRAHGFSPGLSDGSFGQGTLAAVIAFQRSEGMVADGVAGPRTAAALGLGPIAAPATSIPGVTVDVVCQMFPQTPRVNIERNLPPLLDGLIEQNLSDKPMVLMALATIRAEIESFVPMAELKSKFNTSPGGHPFDLYDNRKDLGNTGPPDGARYCGRGFIQLTGRANYAVHSAAIGLGNQLVDNPDLANDPPVAAKLLASFLKSKEVAIKHALLDDDLRTARRLVNGGSHGLDRFTDAYRIGEGLIADTVVATV